MLPIHKAYIDFAFRWARNDLRRLKARKSAHFSTLLAHPHRNQNHGEHVNLSGSEDVRLTTGKDGVAVFDWLPKRFTHSLPFIVQTQDYYVADHATSISEKELAAELTIPLLPLERLSGRVTHADGKPAAGIRVRVQGQGAGHNGFHGEVRTDADGRYSLRVHAEEAYVVAVADDRWAAPYKGGLVIRIGKPAERIDFVLGPATRVHGRVTLGKDDRAVPNVQVRATINLGHIPKELRTPGDRIYHQVGMWLLAHTGNDGHYELFLGPGNYELTGPIRTKMLKIAIPAEKQPREIVQDFRMPRAETGPLAGRVVDEKGLPVSGAVVSGYYASSEARRFWRDVKTGADGRFQVERSLDPLVLRARTADGKAAGVVRISADVATAEIVIRATVSASGRLLDLNGKAVTQAKLQYGIRIYMGEPEDSPFMTAFGGTAVTDGEGRFALSGLVAGERFSIDYQYDDDGSVQVTEIIPKGSTPVAIGDLRFNPERSKPYVPPTPAERTAKAFAPSPATSAAKRLEKLLIEARREYTRPLLLFGQSKDAACIDLFRQLNADPDDQEEKQPRPTPRNLRWEFELAAFDVEQPEVRTLAEKLGVAIGKGQPPILAVLNADGTLAATHPLNLSSKQTLDSRALTDFLVKHKLIQRDAEKMLAEAIKTAKTEDKRVFFITSASWCGPCRLLGRFLDPWKTELNRHYVFVKLDVSRDEHARAVTNRIQGDSDGGVPWYAILDADGKILITSNCPESKRRSKRADNIGFPTEPREIEHFMKMLTQTAPRLAERQSTEIRDSLLKKQ